MRVPVRKLLKSDLVWLGENFCRHNHSFLEHYQCYLVEKPDTSPFQENIGIFDIETTGLKANWSHMLSWCVKEHGKDVIHSDCITTREARDKNDKRIVKSAVEEIIKYDRICGYYSCLTPGHRVLTQDLRWENIENLKAGDKLLAFSNPGYPHFEDSIVMHNRELRAEVYKILLSDGTELESTGNHPWFVRSSHSYRWSTTEKLYKTLSSKMHNKGIDFYRVLPEWDTDNSYEAGWLAGFFDGEGTVSQSWVQNAEQPHYSFMISASQNENVCLQQAMEYLTKLGFPYSVRRYDKNHPNMRALAILGSNTKKLKFLGQLRPKRLLERFNVSKLNAIRSNIKELTKIVKIEKMGKRTICGLGTTTQTYFSNGFASHNSRFDIPYVRSRALYHKMDFPAYRDLYHTDLYYVARSKFAIHSNRLGAICQFFGIEAKNHPMTPELWQRAGAGQPEALEEILIHCREDVESTDAVFELLLDHMQVQKRSI